MICCNGGIHIKVYFENSRGEMREIADVNEECGAYTAMKQFMDDHHFTSYYMRTWNVNIDGKLMTCCDVGSHVEFFYIYPAIKIGRKEV